MEIEVFMTPHWAVNYDPSYPYWVNKIDTVGSGIGWLYSVRDKLGDILQVLMHLTIFYSPLLISLFRMLELGHIFG